MADYDYGGRERTTRYVERRERHGDGRDSYLRVHQSGQLVPRAREESDLSIEEVHRDFPPPGYVRGDIRRARSAEPGAYYEDDRHSVYVKPDRHDDRSYDDRDRGYDRYDDRRRHGSRDRQSDRDSSRDRDRDRKARREDEETKRRRVLSKQEKIIAALVGGAIAVGGKEFYDRREAKQDHHEDVHRNPLASAALGAAGALAAYQGADFYNKKASEKEDKENKSTLVVHKSRDGRVTTGYYSEDEQDSKEKKSNDNFLEKALAAAGMGGAAKMLMGGGGDAKDGKDNKSDSRSRAGSTKSRSKSPKGGTNKVQKAAMASLIAGATEAFRVAKEPGGWKGEKAKRVLTAAAGAASIDAVQKDNKDGGTSKLKLAESVIGGLVGNRIIHGSKNNIEEDKATGRSRSRSRARSDSKGGGSSGLAALATAGLGAFGAKKLMDNRAESKEDDKEREKGRDRSRRRSPDSYDSRDASPEPRKRSRSRSVVDSARRSLAKIGLGNGPEDDRDRDNDSHRGSGRRDRRNDYDDGDSYAGDRRGGRRDDNYDDDRSHRDRSRSRSRAPAGGRRRRGSYSSSDLGDSDEDEKKAKKIRAPARTNRNDDGPYYNDGNPYAALPAPPVGRDRDRDRDRDDRRR